MILSKDAILKAPDVKIEKINVPEWGGEVCLRVFSGKARETYLHNLQKRSKGNKSDDIDIRGMTALLLSMTIVDEGGKLLFDEADIDALSDKSAIVLDRLFQEALKLNRLDAGAVETVEKN